MNLSRVPKSAVIVLGSLALVGVHALIWIEVVASGAGTWDQLLSTGEAGHLNRVVLRGYDAEQWVIFPLFPNVVRIIYDFTNGLFSPQVTGAWFSLFCFAGIIFLAVARFPHQWRMSEEVLPYTKWGWFLFLWAPASYLFHSQHSEALYVLLALLSLYLCYEQRWVAAAGVAGLCALTRIEGIFLGLAVIALSTSLKGNPGAKVTTFIYSLIFFCLVFGLYPLFLYINTGDPIAFITLNSGQTTIDSYLAAFVFGNEWQVVTPGSILRYAFFIALIVAVYFVYARNKPLAFYVLACLAMLPLNGDLDASFRLGIVAFPALFALGDRFDGWPGWVKFILVAVVVVLNCQVTRSYALGRWGY